MQEEIRTLDAIHDEYFYSLQAIDGNVTLYFKSKQVTFVSYLIFKNGYPGEEVPMFKGFPKLSTVYEIQNSQWIEEIKI